MKRGNYLYIYVTIIKHHNSVAHSHRFSVVDDIHEEILTLKKLYGVAFDYEGIILALRIARYSKYPILGGEKETFFFVLEEACERKDLNTDDFSAFALHDDERIQLHDKFMERSNVIGVTEIAYWDTIFLVCEAQRFNYKFSFGAKG